MKGLDECLCALLEFAVHYVGFVDKTEKKEATKLDVTANFEEYILSITCNNNSDKGLVVTNNNLGLMIFVTLAIIVARYLFVLQ